MKKYLVTKQFTSGPFSGTATVDEYSYPPELGRCGNYEIVKVTMAE